MKIAIDCRPIGSSGIGVTLKGILPHLLETKNEFLLIGDTKKINEFAGRFTNYKIAECDIKIFSLKELLFFPHTLTRQINLYDVYYSCFFNVPKGIKIPIFTTIHDVIFPDMPSLTTKIGLAIRIWFYRRACIISTAVFTVSDFSKNRIEHYFKKLNPTLPIIVTYNAIQNFIAESELVFEKKDYILFVGNIKKHKGLQILIEGFKMAYSEGLDLKLVLVGTKENFRTKDSKIDSILSTKDNNIVFTGAVSNAQLLKLYGEALLLVQPSLYEGFCLPPLEALFCKTNVLLSDITVLKEIYDGFPVTFFKTGSPQDLKEKLILLLRNRENLYPVLSSTLKQKYTFLKTAHTIMEELKFYHECKSPLK
ncbi:MAG: glycosyltransferase family 1 protein [Termitinemataceae bacterium]|nr:MAG: glycosyltransferase family 1 protein [Termitinemataceae bacterium]